ncbi:hypothetical protein GVN15_20985 [Pseudomonas putida]|uniref:fimbrial protein n=1 Tax=Pseudomonas TaxID=286 RepID=UPI0013785E74|nr:fimbrial protein [Pseudomonas putida]NBA83116.1 hypothetical protein [Pseudomonas putida]
MKRILALFALGLGCSSAMANTGIINFEGTVSPDGTCPIDIVTPGGPPLPKIYLGDFKVSDFDKTGQKTPLQRFALRIDPAACGLSAPTTAKVKFSPGYGAGPSGLYNLLDGTGYSEGMALAIYDKSGNILPPETASVEYSISEKVPTDMTFSTQLQTIADKVTDGHIATNVSFTVEMP